MREMGSDWWWGVFVIIMTTILSGTCVLTPSCACEPSPPSCDCDCVGPMSDVMKECKCYCTDIPPGEVNREAATE